ncbi:MAG: PEP-CTERM sorting domain-containing protein [Fimbriimonadaceae bacterium]
MNKWMISAGLVVVSSLGSAVTITFDEFGAAPSVFNSANPLRNEYAGVGAIFSGPGPNDGGAILDQSGNFGVNALSGRNFLAFNRNGTSVVEMLNGGHPFDPEQINFSVNVNNVGVFASGGFNAAIFALTAFDSSNTFIGGSVLQTAAGQWGSLTFSSNTNISKVVLTEISNASTFVYDDFSYNSVPEPATMAALGLGVAALLRRRKR